MNSFEQIVFCIKSKISPEINVKLNYFTQMPVITELLV